MAVQLTDQDKDQELMKWMAAVRERQFSVFSPQSLAWLALAPGWTEWLAAQCEFPIQTLDLSDFIQQARNTGLCETSKPQADNESEGLSFWMPGAARRQTLLDLRDNTDKDLLWRSAIEIARRVPSDDPRTPPAMARWALLAGQLVETTGAAARFLTSRVRELIDQDRTGDALAWVATGEDLAMAFGGQLEVAVRAGKRLLELDYRLAQDRRSLANFLERDEQIAAFNELLQDEKAWALHYVGVGGVGKTMLLRHLTAVLAPNADNGPSMPRGRLTTRVDFDYLSPDYPAVRPGQLLLELAAELRLHAASARIEDKFIHFQNTILEWHEALSGEGAPRRPQDILQGPLFDKAVRGFCDILRLLERPVILILDTCEELAKSPVVDSRMPSVEATFAILERLHDAVPTVRVIFAGRRLLARAGSDWKIKERSKRKDDSALTVEGQYLPACKPYLRVHQIRGFARDDADERISEVDNYFDRRKLSENLRHSPELREAILKRSLELGAPLNVKRAKRAALSKGPRYNPFDLALYSDWLREDPSLRAETINSGETDPYVEMRIVGRIKQEVLLRALPAVALLRRFDGEMLRPVIGDSSLFDVYRQFGEQEWISYQIDESRRTSLLEVNRNLHRRLIGYYEHPTRRYLLDEARRALAPALADLARRPLDDLVPEHLDAALRALPPEEAAEVWEDLMRRVQTERDWRRLQNIIKLPRGEAGAISSESHPLFAAARAAEISAQIHLTPSLNVASAWEEVAATAKNHPIPEIGRWLEARALAGRVAAGQFETILPEFQALLASFFHSPEEKDEAALERYFQLCASLIAALESLGKYNLVDLVRNLFNHDLTTDSFPVELRVFYDVLLLTMDRRGSGRRLARIKEEMESLDIPERRHRWLDWRAPDSLIDRVRLEVMLHAPDEVDEQDRKNWVEEANRRLNTIDAERLASLILQLRLAKEVIPEEELEELIEDEAASYEARRAPTGDAHRSAPPLIVSISEGYLALGRATKALEILKQRGAQIVTMARDQDQQHAVELAEALVIWRMRMTENARRFISRMITASNPQRDALIALMRTMCESFNDPIPAIEWPQFHGAATDGEVNGPVGRLTATIERAIAAIRAGGVRTESERESLLGQLREAYERLGVRGGLPQWESLGLAIAHFRPETLFELTRSAGPDWEGWLLRLMGCLVWLYETTEDRGRITLWLDSLKSSYLSGLPAELDLPIAEPQQEQAPVEYSNAWFALYGGVRLLLFGLIGLLLYGCFIRAFLLGANTGAEVLEYWLILFGSLAVASLYGNLLEEAKKDLTKADDWRRRFRRRMEQEKGHPGRIYQVVVKTLARLGLAVLLGLMASLLAGMFLFLRWLWRAYLATFAATHGRATLVIVVSAAIFTALLIFHKRIKEALRSLLTWRELHLDAVASTERPDAAARIDFSARLRQREILFSHQFLRIGALDRIVRELLPFVSDRERRHLTELDPRRLFSMCDSAGDAPRWDATRNLIRLLLRVYVSPAGETEATGQTPGLADYAAAQMTPAKIIEQLKQAKKRLWRGRSTVALRIAPPLALAPWEAMLSMAVSEEPQALEETLLFFRAGDSLPEAERESGLRIWRRATLKTMGNGDSRALKRDWRLPDSVKRLESRETSEARVLHVVGKPLLSSSGVRLQSGTVTGPAGQSVDFSSATSRGGALISSADVRLYRAWLVVIQANPIETLTRLETDREQSALLRAFAAEVFDAGAPAALTLPPMNTELAVKVIRLLADRLDRYSPPGPYQLAVAVSEARGVIARWRPESFDAEIEEAQSQIIANQFELALDVCLFARQRSIETVLSNQ